jgi:tetratricopeptide (TPR) repeat protein
MNYKPTGQVITFYSYKGGTGRTMALANIAWILAANGKRVLVADWDLESPGLHRFFHPFLDAAAIAGASGVIDMIREYEHETTRDVARHDNWHEQFAKVKQHAFPLGWPSFPAGGCLDFLSAGRQNRDYAVSLSALDWDTFYERLGGAQFFDALRADMKSNYDYTLIDSRTGLSDIADICTIHLPDTLVDCFTLSDQGIDGAARVARAVQDEYAARKIRILPVAMRVDDAELDKAEAGRKIAMRRFPGLPTGMTFEDRQRYWAAVQVPYRAFYSYEETLATFGDAPGGRTTLLAAYENLANIITEGEVSSLPPMEEAIRIRGKARFERRDDDGEEEVRLRYAREDQVWAEWIGWVLAWAGIRVDEPKDADQPADEIESPGSRTLTIVSPSFLGRASSYNRLPSRSAVAVYVAGAPPVPAFPKDRSVLVAGLSAAAAADRILRLVGHTGPPLDEDQLARGARFPGEEPNVFNAPTRNARFVGRDDDIQELREQLLSRRAAVVLPVALQGMGGVGKTQLALEYAHRFRSAYDVVWWIQADPPDYVDAQLIDLGTRIGVVAEATATDNAQAVLRALDRGKPFERWLIVYDNADDLERVEPFLPKGHGHVLITSRNREWGVHAHPMPVDVFARDESIAYLRERVSTISQEEADRVAAALGDLPLAIAAAGAWLEDTGTPTETYLEQIDQHGVQSTEATWDLSLNRLHEQSPAAYRLLQLCSVLAPEIALDLVHSDEMAEALTPLDPSLSDRLMRGTLVQQINRLALLKLDVHAGQVQVHRLLQSVVRGRMSGEELETARHQIHLMLASCRPNGEVDNPDTWSRFRMLWPHLEVSGALGCTHEAVRQLLIDRVRFLWLRGDHARGEAFANQIIPTWTEELETSTSATGHSSLKRQLLHLRFNLANIVRDLARFTEAETIDREVLREQTALLGRRHPHALLSAGGLAADLRALGMYNDALEMDKDTYAAWSQVLGKDNPRTLAAANNLATSHRLVGDFRAARSRDEEIYRRRRVVLGPRHPYTLHSEACLGRDLREAGEYDLSVRMLRSAVDAFLEVLGPRALGTLNAQANLAVSLRSAGRHDEAAPILEKAYTGLRERFGPSSADTLACQLSRSTNLLAVGEVDGAETEMQAVWDAYNGSLGPSHPHTLVCESNIAAAARTVGDLRRARKVASGASQRLGDTVGRDHPYTLAATMNLAVCCADQEDWEEARRLLQEVTARLGVAVGADHPDTLRCAANLALTLRARGDVADPMTDHAHAVERLAVLIGNEHPSVSALRAQRLVSRVLDPHPF